jgi:uncharacterized peroxidase-related enzyme
MNFHQTSGETIISTATIFAVPTRDEVSPLNQQLFDKMKSGLGMVPNLYAFFANSPTALGDYLTLQSRKSSLRAKEREVINLIMSQVNECEYCLAVHTVLGKMNGFTDDQLLEIRSGEAEFDIRLNALARFVREVAVRRGKPSKESIAALLVAGYTNESIVDIVIVKGDKTITNYLHGIIQVPIDFPAAPKLESCGGDRDVFATR